MAEKLRIELNSEGIRRFLRSDGIKTVVEECAAQIAANAGPGYSHDTHMTGGRVVASAYTETEEATRDNLENNTLLKATHL